MTTSLLAGASTAPLASPRLVLFDLDGTLVDSAPDLAFAANVLRTRRHLPPLPLSLLRPHVGSGAKGMVGAAMADQLAEAAKQDAAQGQALMEALKAEFLEAYAQCLSQSTVRFEGVQDLLDSLVAQGIAWGIVTNKHTRYALPLIEALGLDVGAAAIVCGDTLPVAKPHPDPLLEAARRAGQAAQDCWYVGDDLRDMQAGRAAGMGCIAAMWGYLGAGGEQAVPGWGAHRILAKPLDLLSLLNPALENAGMGLK